MNEEIPTPLSRKPVTLILNLEHLRNLEIHSLARRKGLVALIMYRFPPGESGVQGTEGSEPHLTTDPSHSYPDHTVHHTYTTLDTFTISLTTTWEGDYSIDGGATWLPISGTTTTENSSPVTMLEYTPLLTDPNNEQFTRTTRTTSHRSFTSLQNTSTSL